MGILAKTGLDTLKVGGHKVPIALVGGVAAVITVVLVLRARSQGAQLASVGQAPATAAGSSFGLPLPGTDVGPALANLSQQLTNLEQQGTNATVAAAPAPLPGFLRSLPGQGADWQIPLSLRPGGPVVGWATPGSQVLLGGAPVPVNYGGSQLLAEPVKYLGGDYFINSLNLV